MQLSSFLSYRDLLLLDTFLTPLSFLGLFLLDLGFFLSKYLYLSLP